MAMDPLTSALLEADANNKSRQELAKTLGVDLKIFQEIVDGFNESIGDVNAWNLAVSERRAQTTATAANWDSIEELATAKLTDLMREGKIKTVSELVQIAKVANQAHRTGMFPTTNPRGNPDNQVLPGGGAVGVIELRLTGAAVQAVQNRLGNDTIDGDFTVIQDPQEMRVIADAEADENA